MSEEGSIRELDQKTVERIAAGEVVERPASVAKELVENSLDADASRVAVAVDAGGKDGIRVTDDGVGMSEPEVRRAVEQHTTSKIRDIEDVESGVATLGFRGEALHAIGAVSRLTITTRPRDSDATGTELVVEGGEVTSVEPAGCPEGTTIEISDLFYNVPARRKYLKQDGTEFAHVNDVVTSYALANPDVRVSLEHGGRETFATTGQGDLDSTVMSVYGREVASEMVAVSPDDEDSDRPDGPLDGVSGLISHPETTRASREYVTTYVNGRYVRSSAVRDAIVDAYSNQLAPDRFPFAVLFLDLSGTAVDVNVHPRKTEVRFADEAGVREQVRSAVENALLQEGIIRSSAPRGQSAPAQTEIDPERTDADGASADDEPAARERDTPTSGNGTQDSSEGADTAPPEPPTRSQDPVGPGDIRDSDGDTETAAGTTATASEETQQSRREHTGNSETETEQAETGSQDANRRFRPGTDQARLGEDGAVEPSDERASYERLPSMRVLGQIQDTYVIAETPNGLVMLDQHAADERINYERLRERFAGETTTQALAEPVELSLTAREAALFEEYEEPLARLGFQARGVGEARADTDSDDSQGNRTVEVQTVPDLLAETADPALLREVLSAFVTGEAAASDTVEAAADEFLADLACYPSITGNTSLTEGSIQELLSTLDDCENPWACPHGRPVVIEVDTEEIEARFERDYPGHDG